MRFLQGCIPCLHYENTLTPVQKDTSTKQFHQINEKNLITNLRSEVKGFGGTLMLEFKSSHDFLEEGRGSLLLSDAAKSKLGKVISDKIKEGKSKFDLLHEASDLSIKNTGDRLEVKDYLWLKNMISKKFEKQKEEQMIHFYLRSSVQISDQEGNKIFEKRTETEKSLKEIKVKTFAELSFLSQRHKELLVEYKEEPLSKSMVEQNFPELGIIYPLQIQETSKKSTTEHKLGWLCLEKTDKKRLLSKYSKKLEIRKREYKQSEDELKTFNSIIAEIKQKKIKNLRKKLIGFQKAIKTFLDKQSYTLQEANHVWRILQKLDRMGYLNEVSKGFNYETKNLLNDFIESHRVRYVKKNSSQQKSMDDLLEIIASNVGQSETSFESTCEALSHLIKSNKIQKGDISHILNRDGERYLPIYGKTSEIWYLMRANKPEIEQIYEIPNCFKAQSKCV